MPTPNQRNATTANDSLTNGQENMPYGKLAYLPMQLWDCFVAPYTYEVEFLPIAAGTTTPTPQPLNVIAFAHFAWTSLACTVTETNNTTFIALANAPLTVQVVSTGSGRQYSSGQVPIPNYAGTGQLLFDFEIPALIRASDVVNFNLANLDTVNAYNVRFSAHGFHLYGFDRNGNALPGGGPNAAVPLSPNVAPMSS